MKSFLYILAAAFLFGACTKQTAEDVIIVDPPEEEIVGNTFATFVVDLHTPAVKTTIGYGTRDASDFYPDSEGFNGHSPSETRRINPQEIRLLIFDNTTQLLEYNDMFPVSDSEAATATATVEVISGNKKVFVFANAETMLISGYGSTQTFKTLFDSFTVGKTTLTDFYLDAVYDAGVPQYVPFENKETRTFNFSELYKQAPGFGFPSSSTNQYTYSLKADVSENSSKSNPDAPDPLLNGIALTQNNNNFTVDILVMLAKARLTYNPSILKTKSADIDDIRYAVRNLSKYTNYVLNVVSGVARSFYYGLTFSNDVTGISYVAPDPPTGYTFTPPQFSHYLQQFDSAADICVPAAEFSSSYAPGVAPFLYLPESNNSPVNHGQAPYIAFSAVYMPKYVVNSVTWVPDAPIQKVAMTTFDIQDEAFTNMDYYYFRGDLSGPGGVLDPATCFKTYELMQKAVWLVMNGSGATNLWTGTSTQQDEADALIGYAPPSEPTHAQLLLYPFLPCGYFFFSESKSYYRLHIGGNFTPQSDLGATPPYSFPRWGAIRGVAYDFTILEISGPGVPYDWMLDVDKPDPLDAIYPIAAVTISSFTD